MSQAAPSVAWRCRRATIRRCRRSRSPGDVNWRRQVRRWIDSLPKGSNDPIVRLRLGQRTVRSGQRPYDFLDVAAPRWSDISPFDTGRQIAEAFSQRFGDASCTVLSAHDGYRESGAITSMAVNPDRRVARYASEI